MLNGRSRKNSQSGFTLIELLVVISIITLLASIILSSATQARRKGRDTKRISDIKQLQTAMDLYYSNRNYYPGGPGDNNVSIYGELEMTDPYYCGGWDSSEVDYNGDGKYFIAPLVDDGVIQKSPHDPIGQASACSSPFGYRYYRYPPGYCLDMCGGNKAFYILGINTFESNSTFSSPGWKCTLSPSAGGGLRDWGTEFAWVAGACE